MLSATRLAAKASLAVALAAVSLACVVPSADVPAASFAPDDNEPGGTLTPGYGGTEPTRLPVAAGPGTPHRVDPNVGPGEQRYELAAYAGPPWGIRLTCTGFHPEDGLVMHAMVIRAADDWPVALDIRPIVDGVARFEWHHLLAPGQIYHVDLFTSDDPFPRCYMPPDRAWRVLLPEANGDLDIYEKRRETQSAEACASFKPDGIEL